MKVIKRSFSLSCSSCGLQQVCFPTGLMAADILRLDEIVNHKPYLEKGEVLYDAQAPFKSIFAIRSGMVKLYSSLEDGVDVIHGFYFAGDVVGLDGIESGYYQMTVEAVTETYVCEISYQQLKTLSAQLPNLSIQLYNVLSKKMNESYYQAQLLAINSAKQRLANFLFHMVERVRLRGYDESSFHLPILHREVANYLGLTPETVSRLLTNFHKQGIVSWKKRTLTLHNKTALKQAAGLKTSLEQVCPHCMKSSVS